MSEELKKEENILEKIKREIFNFKKKKEALVNELRLEFPKLLIPLMEQSNQIKSIGWTQYTPYFNDGDTCEFSVNHYDLMVNNTYEYDCEFLTKTKSFRIKNDEDIEIDRQTRKSMKITVYKRKIGDVGYEPNLDYSESESKIIKDIKSVLKEIPDEFYEDLFGDHVQVTISKDGKIKVTDYEHD